MLPTSMQDTCLGVFLNRSLGGANISCDKKNFSGCVMEGRKPGGSRDTHRKEHVVRCFLGDWVESSDADSRSSA